jgi:hypothetical protein
MFSRLPSNVKGIWIDGPTRPPVAFLVMTRSLAVLLVFAVAGCGPTPEERAARSADSIVAIADSAGRVVRRAYDGREVALMVHECKVYNLGDRPNAKGKRPAVLEPEFYPWPTVCSRESIAADSAFMTIELGRTGFGAGGCCATGGTYRTRDGRGFEREGAGGQWTPAGVDSAR